MIKIETVISAHNEKGRIEKVIKETKPHVNRIIVIDNGSADGTGEISRKLGAEVITHQQNRGYLEAIRTGFRAIRGEVVVTIDAGGENDPADIPKLVGFILKGEADLVLGRGKSIPRLSERFLNFLVGFSVNVSDTGAGFRALRVSWPRDSN
jgi:glycosyltransferase involved in cell wall biosynthesis